MIVRNNFNCIIQTKSYGTFVLTKIPFKYLFIKQIWNENFVHFSKIISKICWGKLYLHLKMLCLMIVNKFMANKLRIIYNLPL